MQLLGVSPRELSLKSFCLLVKGRKKNVLYYRFQIVLQLNYLRGGEVILEKTRSSVFLAP